MLNTKLEIRQGFTERRDPSKFFSNISSYSIFSAIFARFPLFLTFFTFLLYLSLKKYFFVLITYTTTYKNLESPCVIWVVVRLEELQIDSKKYKGSSANVLPNSKHILGFTARILLLEPANRKTLTHGLNSFHVTDFILYSLKTSEKLSP